VSCPCILVSHSGYPPGGYRPVPTRPGEMRHRIDPCFVSLPYLDSNKLHARKSSRKEHRRTRGDSFRTCQLDCITRGRGRRTASLPPPGAWATASVLGDMPQIEANYWIINFQPLRVTELDKMSRPRSLSRTHIRAMFKTPPQQQATEPGAGGKRCANCALTNHALLKCPWPCGYCGKGEHKAPKCLVQPRNRCKCRAFPQGHVAERCEVRCSRRCGNPLPQSGHHHSNAMTCSHRCCMCGSRGHSGKECHLKKCQCGEQHLGQDCRWKVECAVPGCDRYLCGLHCIECGKERGRGSELRYVGRRCPECLANGKPIAPRIDDTHSSRR
jgi:hypothetical protein